MLKKIKLAELPKFIFNSLKKIGILIFKLTMLAIFLSILLYSFNEIANIVFELIDSGQVFELGIAAITPLAITLSFSSLMYSRTRAINSKIHQFRSFYIAERLLTASICYFLLLIASYFCYQFVIRHHIIINFSSTIATADYRSSVILIPMIFFLRYVFEIYHAIFAMKLSFFTVHATKTEAIKVKKLLSLY